MRSEHRDVIIVGAGLSGIGAACRLADRCPRHSFAILEARDAIGGTWDLFRYPGIRSDSDMHTLGYDFRPWTDAKAIADGPSIREYIRATAREHDVERHIRFGHRVTRASWSTSEARWTLEAERTDTGEAATFTCDFLHMCSGYYNYEHGYTPPIPGLDSFAGTVIHPQHWPEEFDYSGKRMVVIGSGATAVTLVPSLAHRAGQVTMLQRSPSYILSLPSRDPLAGLLRRHLPERTAYAITRWRNVLQQAAFFQLSRRRPEFIKRLIRKWNTAALPAGFDVDTHFKPRYDPWDQRVCLVPDGDLFASLSDGRADIVTDRIRTVTEHGIELESGRGLDADVIVTATGLDVQLLGGMAVEVDGHTIDFADTVAYKGMMFSGVPNFVLALGYTNASWTLKADLVSDYVCRLLRYMSDHGYAEVMPVAPPASVERIPLLDFSSGYVTRALDRLPKQGGQIPWRLHQNYVRDVRMLRHGRLDDEGVRFSRRAAVAADVARPAVPLAA